MALLALGLALWIGAHLVKRVVPEARSVLDARIGSGPARGVFAAVIGLGLILIIIGFRRAPYEAIYTPPGWAVHVNNLLMLVAVMLFAASHSKSRVKGWLRNPMLTAVMLWAVAHLLVNGDLASLVLFGGMGVWALASILLIDATPVPATAAPVQPSIAADIRLVVIGLVAFAAITAIHSWLGVSPFPG